MASGGAGSGGAILVMLGGQGHHHLHHVKGARDAGYVDGHVVRIVTAGNKNKIL